MSDLTIADIASHIGQNTGNAGIDIANAVADGVCSIYKNSPFSLVPDPVGAGAMTRALWDTLCNGRTPGLPSPPASPFTGGQCQNVLYTLDYTINYQMKSLVNGAITTLSSHQHLNAYGPIGQVIQVGNPAGGNHLGLTYTDTSGTFHNGVITDQLPNLYLYSGSLSAITITRVDGNPDNCGNPPQTWPAPGTPVGLPTPIPPITVPSPSGGSYTFSPTLILADEVNGIKMSLTQTVNMKIDFGGITFNFGKGAGNGGDNSGDFSQINNKLDNLSNNLNNFQNGFNDYKQLPPPGKAPTPLTHNYQQQQQQEGDKKTSVTNLEFVEVDLTTLPNKDKVIFAVGTSPTVYFAGWFEFLQGNLAFCPRIPIQFEHNIYRAPDGADGYAYCFTNGAAGTVTQITRK